jgi:hypothetical protein
MRRPKPHQEPWEWPSHPVWPQGSNPNPFFFFFFFSFWPLGVAEPSPEGHGGGFGRPACRSWVTVECSKEDRLTFEVK